MISLFKKKPTVSVGTFGSLEKKDTTWNGILWTGKIPIRCWIHAEEVPTEAQITLLADTIENLEEFYPFEFRGHTIELIMVESIEVAAEKEGGLTLLLGSYEPQVDEEHSVKLQIENGTITDTFLE